MVCHHLELQGRPLIAKNALLLDQYDEVLLVGQDLLAIRHRHDELASGDPNRRFGERLARL
jgi:hypothetical protein